MDNQLVTILRITTAALGNLVKDKFESEGIECFFTNEGTTIGSKYNPDEVLLKVRTSDSEKAIKILLQLHKENDLDQVIELTSDSELKKILVPVKLGEDCIELCRYAFSLAQKNSAEVKLLYVYPDPTIDESVRHTVSWEKYVKMELQEAFNEAQEKLINFSLEIKKHIPEDLFRSARVHYRMLKGVPEYVITDAADRYHPDLILMGTKGTHENGEFKESTILKVVDLTNYPVLVVPFTSEFKGKDKLKVMYATDFHDADNSSLDKLLAILRPYEKEISCVHIDTHEDNNHAKKVNELNKMLAENYSVYNIKCILFEGADVAEGIKMFTEKNEVDLISFSKMKRSAFYKMFHSNLLQKIISTEKVPMLIFPV